MKAEGFAVVSWFAAALVMTTVSATAQVDQSIYSDALNNGWQNWSWATVNLNNANPVHSGTRSASVTAGGYQAIYLHHDAFATGTYDSISFWIHGGSKGGQLLQVQALLNGTAQAAVPLDPLTANSWKLITVSLSSLGVAAKPNMDGFWIQSRTSTSQATFYLDDIALKALPAPSSVNLTINSAQIKRTVDARQFGVNAAVWDSVFGTATTSSLLTEMGNQALRFPGGSLSDEYHWFSNTSGNNTWQWATSFDSFAQIASATHAQVFITVNYGSGTAQEAADWVQYANSTLNLGIKFWEIGNENYGTWETDNNTRPHDPYTYAQRYREYVTKMKGKDSSIKVGAVVITGEDSYANYTDHPVTNPRTGQTHNGWTPVLLTTLKGLGVTPDFIIYHRYSQAPGAESDSGLLQSSGTWATDAADLRQQLNDYLGAAGGGVELVCTENNSVYSNPGKQTTSLVNGLFLADSIGSAMQTEFNALLWWDLRNGQETGNNNSSSLYGWRPYGDYGIVDGANPAGPADRYPTFYVMKLLQNFARGGDHLIEATSDYGLLTPYAAVRADGSSLSLLVINKSSYNTFLGNISLAGYTLPASGSAMVYSYGIPQDEAARTGTGSADVAHSSVSISSATFAYSFPPYSATVIALGGSLPPPPQLVYQPDNLIKLTSDSSFLGNGIWNTDGANQTRTTSVKRGRTATFMIQVQNDGQGIDSFTLGANRASSGFTVQYLQGSSGSTDITTAVTAGTYTINSLSPGASQLLRAVITVGRNTPVGSSQTCLITSTSKADSGKQDAVKAVVSAN
jgi:alpha-L-arabinofuranosidase